MKFYQYGRSMVEMLGVLAIIGVLSVGAISGYSKAMFKYKLNKQTEQLMEIFSAVLRNIDRLYLPTQQNTTVTSYLFKMNEISSDLMRVNKPNYMYDIFGNEMYIAVNNQDRYITWNMEMVDFRQDKDVCYNMVSTFKQFSSQIFNFEAVSTPSGASSRVYHLYYGDNYCDKGENCFYEMTAVDISALCDAIQRDQERTTLNVRWK